MIPATTYDGDRVAVFGLGASGLATARSLTAGGAEVLAWDDTPARREALEQIPGARPVAPDAAAWAGVAALALSPGVPLTHPEPHPVVRLADSLGLEILGDVELFARARPEARVVAITGTNGKSTTTALLGHLLAAAGRAVEIGANLGQPVLDLAPLPEEGVYVLELSSYQIDLTRSLRPEIAVLLNVSPDHLDRHGDMAGYVGAKRRLLEMGEGALLIGVDDEHGRRIADDLRSAGREVLALSLEIRPEHGIFVDDGEIFALHAGRERRLAGVAGLDTLRGRHNHQNAAAAVAIADRLGLTAGEIEAGLAGFPGLPHRMQRVAGAAGVAFVNDSKATNAEATSHALAAFRDIHWIVGGRAKAEGLRPLLKRLDHVARAYLIGEAAERFRDELDGRVACEIAGDLATAVERAALEARGGGAAEAVVLLSPACASFDQFPSFEARGAAFTELATGLVARWEGAAC